MMLKTKTILVFLLLFGAINTLKATIYYVSTTGLDTNNGTSLSISFKTIQKAASVMVAGDTCYVRQGTYRETVTPANSGTSTNPIRFYVYNNESVTVSGADIFNLTWSVHSGSIYKASTNLNFIQLFVNGVMMNEARWPNAVVDDLLHMPRGTTASGSNETTIVDSNLPAGDWNNANVQLMFEYWGYIKKVTNYQAGNRFNFDTALPGGYGPRAGSSKYYLFGKLIALDTATEWYLDNASDIVYLWSPNSLSPSQHTVEIKQRDYAFNLSNKSYIEVKGFNIFASAVNMTNSQNCTIDSCSMKYGDHNSVHNDGYGAVYQSKNTMSGSYNEWKNSTIAYSAHAGILVYGSYNKVTNCVIHDIGYLPTTSAAIATPSSSNNSNQTFNYNTIYNCGYIGVMFYTATKYNIQYNDISNVNLLCNDGGVLYTYQSDGGGTVISHNWTHDNSGNLGIGIYLDNGSANFIVHHNVSWNNEDSGIRLNLDSTNNLIYNNTILNNGNSFNHWPGSGSQSGTKIINNIANNTINLVTSSEGTPPESHHNGDYSVDANFVPTPGSGAIDAGVVLSGYTDGYVGSAPDIGAYEYGATYYWIPGARLESNPPSAIGNLTTSNLASTSVRLNWTAVGDDGTTGTAITYDIRYIIGIPVTNSNWSSATQCTGEPAPGVAGVAETFTVNNLIPDTNYYFAIKVRDESQNWSQVSNSPSGRTLAGSPPVGEWHFEENTGTIANDSSGNNNTGTLVNSPVWTTGRIGKGLQFNGGNYVSIPNSASLNPTTALTIEAWFRKTADVAYQRILAKSNYPNWEYALYFGDTGAMQGAIGVGGTTRYSSMSSVLSVGTWYFVTLTYDNSRLRLYVNGVEQGSGNSYTGSIDARSESVCIGKDGGTSGAYFSGIIDEVVIYNRCLTSAEILAHYNRDALSPAAINNLSTSNPTTTSVTLQWTSVGDDGTTGTAQTYDIRQQTYTITAGNWANATQCNGEPTPKINNSNESFTVTGLTNNTTYYFGIKVGDEVQNWSALSNIATGKTQVIVVPDTTAPSAITNLTFNIPTPDIPPGAASLGYTKCVINEHPSISDFAPSRNGTYKWYRGVWWGTEPSTNLYTMVGNELAISLNGSLCAIPIDHLQYGLLPALPGADGFYIEFDVRLSNNDADHWPAVWLLPREKTGGYGDKYPGDPTNFERWMELDVDEQEGADFRMNGTVHSWTGIYPTPGFTSDMESVHSTNIDRTALHTYGASYDPITSTVKWWLDGEYIGSGTYPHVPTIAAVQHFYPIISNQTHGLNVDYTLFLSGVRAYVPQSSSLPDVIGATSSSITLTWTSTGDDGTTGTAMTYDIRQQTYTITASNWPNATQCTGEPAPQVSGTNQTYTITNLSANTTYYFGIKAGDEVINWSDLSNTVSTRTVATDTTAPSQIPNLTTSNPTTTSIVLNWTSVGEDGTTGTAASYDIRYATYSINTVNWDIVTQFIGEPSPKTRNSNESLTVAGLASDTTYYFSIKVNDEVPNYSGLSNIAQGKTQAVIVVDSTAPAAIGTLTTNNPTINSITLTWTSVGDDGAIGTATGYDIRYATYSISVTNWDSVIECAGEPSPNISGTNETFVVNNLASDTTYYFAMKAGDEVPNWSGISDIATGKTNSNIIISIPPVSEWQFEEGAGSTAADTSGNSNTGTLYNSPQWVEGAVGNYAIAFDGLNTYVSVPDNTTLDITTSITLESWVKTDVITTDGGSTRRVIEKGVYSLAASDQLYFKVNISGTSRTITKSWTSSDIGHWHHIVGTYDSAGGTNNLKLYQDGELVASATYTGIIDTNNNVLTIGRQGSTTGRFDGVIDEVRIYNRAITASEVLLHYQGTIPEQDVTPPNAVNNLATGNPTTTTITLTWTAVGDDGLTGTATSYDIRYQTYTLTNNNWSTVAQLTGEPTPKVSGSNETCTISNLTSDTTYYIGIKALDERSNTSAVSNIVTGKTQQVVIIDSTPPGTINTLTSDNPTYTSITLQWTATGDDGTTGTATLYDIRYLVNTQITASNFATAIQASGEPVPSVTGTNESYTINNLANGTTYYFAIKAGDETPNYSGISNIISARTLGTINDTIPPNQITTLSAVSVTSTTIVLRWIAPGDDETVGTSVSYDIRYTTITELSTSNWGETNIVTEYGSEPVPGVCGTEETIMLTGLAESTTYYIAIKAADDAGNNSELSYILAKKTNPIPQSGKPNAVSYLTATQQNNNTIQLNWLISTSSDVASYRIYIATGDNALDYTTPGYVVSSTVTSITITNLTSDQSYKFIVHAVDTDGDEDISTAIISEVAVTNISGTAVRLFTPGSGITVNGKRLTLMADPVASNSSTNSIASVTFEYKKAADTAWIVLPVSQAGLTNPDTVSPYYIQCDITNLDLGAQYNIRAVTTDTNGVKETVSGYITITITDTDPDIYESARGSVYYKTERVDNRKLNTVKVIDTYTNLISSVKISTGVLTNGNTDLLKIVINPQSAPQVTKNLIQIGYLYQIEMISGQTEFTEDIEITLPYKDVNSDNRIPAYAKATAGEDDTDISIMKLIVCTANNTTKKWEKVTTTTLDKTNKQLTAKTKHLSYYGIFAVIQSDLNTAHVYPNPFKPSLGHTNIFFANLTTKTKIKVFNIAGELVYEDEKNTPAGELSWDVKNNNSEPIASGVYIYMISNNQGQTKRGKLAIIR